MSSRTLRLIQASDFHLERPLRGVTEVPDHLRDLFLDAPFTAAEQVFETAVAERVDLVALAGGIVNPRQADPRAVIFLERQFRRLAEHGIQVYWSGGPTDAAGQWRRSSGLTENVHIFAKNTVEERVHYCNEEPVARIIGFSRGRGGKLRIDAKRRRRDGLPTIGIGHGAVAFRPLADLGTDLIALGGQHARQERTQGTSLVHYSGAPQGHSPEEPGSHGCSLVTIDPAGAMAATAVVTDVARWVDVDITMDANANRATIEERLERAMTEQIATARGVDLLITWRLSGPRGPILRELCHGNLSTELLAGLRARHGHTSPAAWSVSLTADLPAPPVKDDNDAETILGEFLSVAARYRADSSELLDLGRFLPERLTVEAEVVAAARPRRADHRRLLDQAIQMGADLLGGSGSRSGTG